MEAVYREASDSLYKYEDEHGYFNKTIWQYYGSV